MIKQLLELQLYTMVLLVLLNDDTKVTLYAVNGSTMSQHTRKLPSWYTTLPLAKHYARGRRLVRTQVTVSMLVGHNMVYIPSLGDTVILMHGVRRYAQRTSKVV